MPVCVCVCVCVYVCVCLCLIRATDRVQWFLFPVVYSLNMNTYKTVKGNFVILFSKSNKVCFLNRFYISDQKVSTVP